MNKEFIKGLTIGLLMVFILLIFCIQGCSVNDSSYVQPSFYTASLEMSDFKLIVDEKTGIVYIDNTFDYEGGPPAHIYTPYYSNTGTLCRYINGEIVPVKALDNAILDLNGGLKE